MADADDIARIQSCIRNRLDRRAIGTKQLVAVIGDFPSRYSKSPSLWNPAFHALRMKAVYVALDVDNNQLPALMAAIRASDRILGLQVTVPHKVAVMNHLDGLDNKATRIGAVNTIVRTEKGKLVGSNTDGQGFLQSLSAPQSGQRSPFLQSLKGIDVLILGAGGSARAVAFTLAEKLESGRLLICNRALESARSLAAEITKTYGNAGAIGEDELPDRAPRMQLIVNCTVKGQGGIRKSSAGLTALEPYSALAPANPATLPASEEGPDFYRAWLSASLADIEANNRASWNLALSIPLKVGFCDLIYFPAETVLLRHGRLSGHRTLNGKGMIVAQAVEAFFDNICRPYLEKSGLHNPETYTKLLETMERSW